MRVLDMIVFAFVLLLIAVSFANPGGTLVAVALALIVIGARYGLPLVSEYVISAHSGKKGRMMAQKARKGTESNDDGGGR